MKNVWLLHMDEESQLTPQALAGIHRFINVPENAMNIGEGEIKYNGYLKFGSEVRMGEAITS